VATSGVKFRAFHVSGLDFSRLPPGRIHEITEALLQASTSAAWWEDPDGYRYSLIRCDFSAQSYVYGLITQQHSLEQHLYDDRKRETRGELDSYDDRLFILDFTNNRLILEWRQFRGKPPLTLRLMLRRMSRILNDIIRNVLPSSAVDLLPIERETTKDQFIDLFYSYRIIVAEVENIGAYRVPEEVQLVNPNPHLEGAIRDLLEHDYERNALDRLTAEVTDNSEGDLRRAAVVRGALHSGNPKMLKFERPNGQVQIRQRNENGIIEVNVPVLATDSPRDRSAMAATVLAAMQGVDLSELPNPPREPAQISIFNQLDFDAAI